MFIGHFAVAMGAAAMGGKQAAPSLRLGTWFLAVQWLDLIWPVFLLLGWEQVVIDPGNTAVTPLNFVHYPYTHSLLAALLWGVLFAGVLRWRGAPLRVAAWAGGAVLSHWVLDLLTHRPDLPLYPGGPMVGLGLWHSVPGTLAVELLLFLAGTALYLRGTGARDAVGRWALWGLLGFLLVVYAGNLAGPPPPSATAIGWVGLSQWLLVAWGYWIDRHRSGRQLSASMPGAL